MSDDDDWAPTSDSPQAAMNLEKITEVLVAVASGNFDVRAPRSHGGDPWDVLAFLANQTADEVKHLVEQQKTERRELEEAQRKLHQAEKLAALGELAGGVAHELNQPLTVMQTLAELLLEKPEKTIEERRRELELIRAAAARMGRIVSAVRTFGRQAPLELTEVDLRVPVTAAISLLDETFRAAGILVELKIADDAPRVRGDSEALQQVFINLFSNARDVLDEHPSEDTSRIVVNAVNHEGGARVMVDDNGPGVPAEFVEKLFDPFFSTKSVGRGTGLGLSISHGIITEHGGSLSYAASPLGGACFLVDFPPAGDEPE